MPVESEGASQERRYSLQMDRKGVHLEKRESTSIKMNPELWKRAKIEAINRGLTVSKLVEIAIEKELGLPK